MHPEDIVILGPTSSGKTNLALCIASHLSYPIFNCDSIQVYKDLNVLSNKPTILGERIQKGELESITDGRTIFNYVQYSGFSFHIVRKKDSILTVNRELDALGFFKWLVHTNLAPDRVAPETEVINYLFNIREPLSAYSASDFSADVARISSKHGIDKRIIAGGTTYYAYHYLMGTDFSKGQAEVSFLDNELSLDELKLFLEENDPDAINLIDLQNPQRVKKAVGYIKETGLKFSDSYFKEMNIRNDFLLIVILPNERDVYVKHLEKVVKDRIVKGLDEVRLLAEKYGEDGVQWLKGISYEYRFALEIYEYLKINPDKTIESPEVQAILDILVIKERQYTKRQMTFLRKLLVDILPK